MKIVKFARAWPDRIDDTTVEEWPAGWSGEISDERAARAQKAGVLDGEPKAPKASSAKTTAAKTAPNVPTVAPTADAPTEAAAAPETGD